MYTYSKVSTRVVVNHHSGLYTNCTTLKLVVYIANMVWSILVQTDDLYPHNKVGQWLSAIQCIGINIHYTIPKLVLYVFVTSNGA